MFFRVTEGGVDLFVRLTPRGGSDRIDGMMTASDGREYLAVRVRAIPEKGAANSALEALLAKVLSVPKGSVKVVAGHTARVKTVRIEGNVADLAAPLTELANSR